MSIVSQTESSTLTGAAQETGRTQASKKTANYGKTIGKPELSEKAQEYYEKLKKKFSNMDFVLVSKDMKEIARSKAGNYANPNRMVVLVDEEKIEKMASDENFRRQYEGIISNAGQKLPQLKKKLGSNASKVKTFGMQINEKGMASFFAVVDKSLAAQKKRIAKNAEKKASQKKADAKKEAEEAAKERLDGSRADKYEESEDTVIVTASTMEELIEKIQDTLYEGMSDNVWTESEKMIGQHFDSRW